jgi:hypothetical protein
MIAPVFQIECFCLAENPGQEGKRGHHGHDCSDYDKKLFRHYDLFW